MTTILRPVCSFSKFAFILVALFALSSCFKLGTGKFWNTDAIHHFAHHEKEQFDLAHALTETSRLAATRRGLIYTVGYKRADHPYAQGAVIDGYVYPGIMQRGDWLHIVSPGSYASARKLPTVSRFSTYGTVTLHEETHTGQVDSYRVFALERSSFAKNFWKHDPLSTAQFANQTVTVYVHSSEPFAKHNVIATQPTIHLDSYLPEEKRGQYKWLAHSYHDAGSAEQIGTLNERGHFTFHDASEHKTIVVTAVKCTPQSPCPEPVVITNPPELTNPPYEVNDTQVIGIGDDHSTGTDPSYTVVDDDRDNTDDQGNGQYQIGTDESGPTTIRDSDGSEIQWKIPRPVPESSVMGYGNSIMQATWQLLTGVVKTIAGSLYSTRDFFISPAHANANTDTLTGDDDRHSFVISHMPNAQAIVLGTDHGCVSFGMRKSGSNRQYSFIVTEGCPEPDTEVAVPDLHDTTFFVLTNTFYYDTQQAINALLKGKHYRMVFHNRGSHEEISAVRKSQGQYTRFIFEPAQDNQFYIYSDGYTSHHGKAIPKRYYLRYQGCPDRAHQICVKRGEEHVKHPFFITTRTAIGRTGNYNLASRPGFNTTVYAPKFWRAYNVSMNDAHLFMTGGSFSGEWSMRTQSPVLTHSGTHQSATSFLLPIYFADYASLTPLSLDTMQYSSYISLYAPHANGHCCDTSQVRLMTTRLHLHSVDGQNYMRVEMNTRGIFGPALGFDEASEESNKIFIDIPEQQYKNGKNMAFMPVLAVSIDHSNDTFTIALAKKEFANDNDEGINFIDKFRASRTYALSAAFNGKSEALQALQHDFYLKGHNFAPSSMLFYRPNLSHSLSSTQSDHRSKRSIFSVIDWVAKKIFGHPRPVYHPVLAEPMELSLEAQLQTPPQSATPRSFSAPELASADEWHDKGTIARLYTKKPEEHAYEFGADIASDNRFVSGRMVDSESAYEEYIFTEEENRLQLNHTEHGDSTATDMTISCARYSESGTDYNYICGSSLPTRFEILSNNVTNYHIFGTDHDATIPGFNANTGFYIKLKIEEHKLLWGNVDADDVYIRVAYWDKAVGDSPDLSGNPDAYIIFILNRVLGQKPKQLTCPALDHDSHSREKRQAPTLNDIYKSMLSCSYTQLDGNVGRYVQGKYALSGGGKANCSGFLLDRSTIVTTQHCLQSRGQPRIPHSADVSTPEQIASLHIKYPLGTGVQELSSITNTLFVSKANEQEVERVDLPLHTYHALSDYDYRARDALVYKVDPIDPDMALPRNQDTFLARVHNSPVTASAKSPIEDVTQAKAIEQRIVAALDDAIPLLVDIHGSRWIASTTEDGGMQTTPNFSGIAVITTRLRPHAQCVELASSQDLERPSMQAEAERLFKNQPYCGVKEFIASPNISAADMEKFVLQAMTGFSGGPVTLDFVDIGGAVDGEPTDTKQERLIGVLSSGIVKKLRAPAELPLLTTPDRLLVDTDVLACTGSLYSATSSGINSLGFAGLNACRAGVIHNTMTSFAQNNDLGYKIHANPSRFRLFIFFAPISSIAELITEHGLTLEHYTKPAPEPTRTIPVHDEP